MTGKIRRFDWGALLRAIGAAEAEIIAQDFDELVLPVLDVSRYFDPAITPQSTPVTGFPTGSGDTNPTASGDLYTTDPADTTNQTQDITQSAGGANVFSGAGFKLAARATLPTRLDLVDFFLRPSVDCQIGIAFENSTAAFAGKALVGGGASARSGVVDAASTGGSKRAVVANGADANVRFWVPFHALNTVFRWQPPNPEFRVAPGAIPDGLRVICVADLANTAIRVQWGVIWRQVI